jgi:predicted dithiol-disulfide oxidoreductase (DUF899 family)
MAAVREDTTRGAHPPIVDRSTWRAARLALLAEEKALTRAKDAVNAARRRLPMVPIDEDYRFTDGTNEVPFIDLFGGARQLIVYHFMFDPDWQKGCGGCTSLVDAIGSLAPLAERDVSFALVSRAPDEKLEAYRCQHDWPYRWVSSFGSRFNHDFHVTLDAAVAPPEYNYRGADDLQIRADDEPWFLKGEQHGLSVFFRLGARIFHTYSTYARGCEGLSEPFNLLDVTPYGRQQDFESSPAGWPQRPTYG